MDIDHAPNSSRQRRMRTGRVSARVMALATLMVLVGCVADAPAQASEPPSPTPAVATPRETASPSARATPTPSPRSPSLTRSGLRRAVSVASIRAHLEELQRIADAHGGNRAAATAGFDASVEYVAVRLEAAGYSVERQLFTSNGQAGVNVVAELQGTQPEEVVMLGAHLDSAPDGPGINDNGSGSMTLLALAEGLAIFERPLRTVRFAFWGAEEPGRHGSTAHVASLGADERQRVTAYLNLDLIGSPNFIRFVYADSQAAPGSEAITQLFAAHFAGEGLAWEPIDLSGKSDHAAFAQAGIPTGGLFSGGREPKTDAQATTFGGTAGLPADGCADHACDTIDNVNDTILEQMADAAAHALATLAGG